MGVMGMMVPWLKLNPAGVPRKVVAVGRVSDIAHVSHLVNKRLAKMTGIQ
jgi:hypothetical protein